MKASVIKLSLMFLALIFLTHACKKQEPSDPDFWDFVIKLNISPQAGTVDTEFTFNAEGSIYTTGSSPYKPIESFSWDFNYTGPEDVFWDIEYAANPIQTHSYDSLGTYEVVLVGHGAEESKSITRSIVVSNITNTPPIAFLSIGGSPGYPYVYLFTFDPGLCEDQEDPYDSLKVRWDWENDGTYDTEFSIYKNATHVYNYTGEIEVKMQVKDKGGLLDDITKSLIVQGPGGEPCPGTELGVDHGGDSYTTVQIGDQCWLNENLNIGTMILSNTLPSQNTPDEIIEKYCYDNDPVNCVTYGGLYTWDEMMQYIETEGVQGICPDGWHIPTDEEWKKLEGAVDSQYGYPDPEWDKVSEYRGQDIGWNIRSQTIWAIGSGGFDKFGFGVLGGGRRYYTGSTEHLGGRGYFWTSTSQDENQFWCRYVGGGGGFMARESNTGTFGYSVRCLKNE